jgi:hypothetical protein
VITGFDYRLGGEVHKTRAEWRVLIREAHSFVRLAGDVILKDRTGRITFEVYGWRSSTRDALVDMALEGAREREARAIAGPK